MNNKLLYSTAIFLILIIPSISNSSETSTSVYKTNFDTTKAGQLPEGWFIAQTQSAGWFRSAAKPGDLAKWAIKQDSQASSGQNTLAITKINHSSSAVFNIIHTNKFKFKNGEINVKVRAISGEIDQGGGPIWRFKDSNNYYVARYNPLEGNFRVYYVKNGARRQLKSASHINIKQAEWFEIKIIHTDDHIVAWLNGKKLLDVRDSTHQAAGDVGLWTKADAMSAFDDFSVKIQ